MPNSDKSGQPEKSKVSIALRTELQGILESQDKISEKKQLQLLQLVRGWKNPQRRQEERKTCPAAVDFTVDGRLYAGSILDISTGGACINCDETFRSGQDVVLTFQVPETKEPIKATGKIVWAKPNCIGVTFETVSDYLYEYLGEAIEQL